jgi:hypothetical protein
VAVLSTVNVQTLYNQAGADLVALFALRNVSTGDTLDLGITDVQPQFQVIRKAVVLSVGANLAAVAAITGTVVTIPAGLAAAGAYLLITGC